MSFDESKVTRDDHGRFSGGGLGGFVAKHTGKLEGFSAPSKGDLGKWTAAKLSDRARNIEIPLVRKTDEHFASTGAVPMIEVAGPTVSRPEKMIKTIWEASQKAEFAANKREEDSLKAEDKVKIARDKALREYKNQRIYLESAKLTGPRGEPGASPEKIKQLETKMAKIGKKIGKLNTQIDHENDIQKKAANESVEATERSRVYKIARDVIARVAGTMNPQGTVEVSHDHNGAIEIHLSGRTHDSKYPGEKSTTIRLEPATLTSAALTSGKDYISANNDLRMHIVSQYPTDTRGKDHPQQAAEKEVIGAGVAGTGTTGGRQDFLKAVDEHVKNFFSS